MPDITIPRARAWQYLWDLSRLDEDDATRVAIPETSDVSAWLSLTQHGEPITPGSVVVLERMPLELRTDSRRLWTGILDRDAVTDALEGIVTGGSAFEVVEVDGERDSREMTVED